MSAPSHAHGDALLADGAVGWAVWWAAGHAIALLRHRLAPQVLRPAPHPFQLCRRKFCWKVWRNDAELVTESRLKYDVFENICFVASLPFPCKTCALVFRPTHRRPLGTIRLFFDIKPMPVDQTISHCPAKSGFFRAFRYGGLISVASLATTLNAGVVLAQVLQQPAAAPLASAEVVPPAAPVKFDVVSVQRGDIQQLVDAKGKLQFYKYADANVHLAGQIKNVAFSIGDQVQSGDVVIEITPTTPPAQMEKTRSQMARLQAELADQRAQMDFAELQFKRQTQLKAQNATREDAFESSRMNLSSASARVDSINAQIRQVEATLKMEEDSRQHTQVLAPISGTIVALNARAGQMVSDAQAAAPLVRIADLSKMTVQARVAEIDVTRLRRGMTANFKTPGYPDRVWSGKLRQVLPVPADGSGEQGKQTFYNVLFEVDNPEQELMSGMSTQVQFIVAQAKDCVLLPANLLGRADAHGQYSVNVVGADGQLAPRKVKIGLRNQQNAQVISGLTEGEQLLVGPEQATPPKQKTARPIAGNTANSTVSAAVAKPAGPATAATTTPPINMLSSVRPLTLP